MNRSFDQKQPLDSGAYHRVPSSETKVALRIWTATKDVCNCWPVIELAHVALAVNVGCQ